MGAYNTLIVNETCCNCNKDVKLRIQFKFGDCWQHEYFLGSKIAQSTESIKNLKRIVLDGVSESCENCNYSCDYLIFIEYGMIKSIKVNRGEYDFTNSKGYYLILDE